MIINLTQQDTGALKQAKYGFSWTFFFFGPWVPVFRGDFLGFFITFVVTTVTFGLAWFYYIFAYNQTYIKRLLSKGYKPADDVSTNFLRSKGLIV